MIIKIKLDGRRIVFFGPEDRVPPGETYTDLDMTEEEYTNTVNAIDTVVSNKGIPCWVDGSIIAAGENDPEYDVIKRLRAIQLEKTRIIYGIDVRAFLGYLCEQNNYTPVEYGQMLADSDLSLCSALLANGALESCKAVVDAYEPTSYFTNDMKTELSAELQRYINMVNV